MKQFHKKCMRGFTLVELLVVIALLAVVAVIASSMFGSPMAKASVDSSAVKIYDDMRTVSDAWNMYYSDKTADPSALGDLVTNSNLKALPVAPSNAKDSAFAGTYAYATETGTNVAGSATNDTALKLPGVTDDICKKINEKYSDIGASIPATVTASKAAQCYKPVGGDNTVLFLVMTK